MSVGQATATTEPVGAPAGTEPPRLTGPQPLTDALIDSISRGHCGWTRKQLEILGVPWPAQSGWRQRLVIAGRILSSEEVDELYAARKAKRATEPDPAEISVLPCPWCSRPVQRIEQGGNVREFCSRKHKNLFNAALTTASIAHSRLLRVPGALRKWTEGRVNPAPGGADGSPRPIPGAGQQDTPSAAFDDDLPF